MPKTRKKLPIADTMRHRLTNELAGILDYLPELEKYCNDTPNDKWAHGQLKYFIRRLDEIQEILDSE